MPNIGDPRKFNLCEGFLQQQNEKKICLEFLEED